MKSTMSAATPKHQARLAVGGMDLTPMEPFVMVCVFKKMMRMISAKPSVAMAR